MERYNKIDYYNKIQFGKYCLAFDKIDGSNVRFQWNRKRGFYKFGTRNNLIDRNDEIFGPSIDIFLNKYSDDIERVFRKKYRSVDTFVVFGEFFGKNSFAGRHTNEAKDVVIFDIHQYKRGIISPYEFVEDFGHLHIPDVIYTGPYTMDFVQTIRDNKYNLKEGVIVKGILKTKNQKDEVWMVKVKTKEWLQRVKELHGERALLEELNGDGSLLLK
jgi:hypothetical protein